jgi:aryl-alcohol dehydrogenase-like predicted oxidoreductase
VTPEDDPSITLADANARTPRRRDRPSNLRDMQVRPLGSLSVSVVGLGCNQFARNIDEAATKVVIDAALDAGINLLDTSDRYGNGDHPFSGRGRSEEFIGRAVAGRRDRVLIATKFGNQMGDDPRDKGGRRRYVRKACEASLARLGTDYIDLYQMHRPDPETPIAQTLEILTELAGEGKVREIACCNFTAEQLTAAMEASEQHGFKRLVSVQSEYSLLYREPETDGVLDVCCKYGVGFLPYMPLAEGLLTGKYTKGKAAPEGTRLAVFPAGRPHLALTDENLGRVDRLASFAAARGRTLLELAFSWLASRDCVASVVAGATKPEQVRANASAAGWALSADEIAELDAL